METVTDSHEYVRIALGKCHNEIQRLEAVNADLLKALEAMLDSFVTGEHYETRNPHTRPYVKQAQAAIAAAKGET